MDLLTYQKIGLRIAAGFIALILLLISFSIFIGMSTSQSYLELQKNIVLQHKRYETILQLDKNIAQLRRTEKNIILSLETPNMLTGNIAEFTQAMNTTNITLGKLDVLLSKPDDLKIIRNALKQYQAGIFQLSAQIQAEQFPSSAVANQNFIPYKSFIYLIENHISQLGQEAERLEIESINDIAKIRIQRLWQIGFAALSLTLLSISLAYLVTRNSIKWGQLMEHQANHDALTGLLNRRGFEEKFNEEKHTAGALLYLDLDQFKLINDLCSHEAGDELLLRQSRRLNTINFPGAHLARLDGDEFCIYLPQATEEQAIDMAKQLIKQVQQDSFIWQQRAFSLNASIGIAMRNIKSTYRELVTLADTACRIAKGRGQGQIAHASEADQQHEQMMLQMTWAAQIPQMLQQNRFMLFYQKMENLQNPNSQTEHAEILIRGLDEDGQIVPPGLFLPAAERFNLINRIDRWVARALLDRKVPPNTLFSINLSGPSVGDQSFLKTLEEWIKSSPLTAQQICFEITETAAMTDIKSAKNFISTLKALGCRFALDDFGSGFSSFSYLKDLQVDYLKIDGSMIRNLERNESDVALVTAIIQMAKALKLRTIAEFVENDTQKEILRNLGVDYAQGFSIHKPEPMPTLE